MSAVEYAVNTQTYDTKYQTGYGLRYPDGHVIRFYQQILAYDAGLTSGAMLDYGCGTGTHLQYFMQQGFTPYGCDVSPTAIGQCQALMPAHAEHFHVIPSIPRLRDYFAMDFDLVFSNQVLYFLNDDDMRQVLSQLYDLLKPGGIFYATMIASTNYYARFVEGTERGLSRVVLRGRLNETQCVTFKTSEQVLELFTSVGLTKIQLGRYGTVIREDEGPTDHHIFVGRKPHRSRRS